MILCFGVLNFFKASFRFLKRRMTVEQNHSLKSSALRGEDDGEDTFLFNEVTISTET